MKKLTLLLLLIMAPGLGGERVAFANQAAASGAPGKGLGARPVYESGTEHQISPLDKKNPSNKNTLLPAGPTNEVDVKRLKLMFLLMMTLGQYRTPVQ